MARSLLDKSLAYYFTRPRGIWGSLGGHENEHKHTGTGTMEGRFIGILQQRNLWQTKTQTTINLLLQKLIHTSVGRGYVQRRQTQQERVSLKLEGTEAPETTVPRSQA